jgi:hypothetical protein
VFSGPFPRFPVNSGNRTHFVHFRISGISNPDLKNPVFTETLCAESTRGFQDFGDLEISGTLLHNCQNFRKISEKPKFRFDTFTFFFGCFSCFRVQRCEKWKKPKPQNDTLGLYFFWKFFEGVFGVFRTFNLESGVKFRKKGVFDVFEKKALSNHRLSLPTFTWGENLNIGHKKRILFQFSF